MQFSKACWENRPPDEWNALLKEAEESAESSKKLFERPEKLK